VDRHADIQEKDLDERMHTTPYFHATLLPNVNPKNLVQIGIGGWQVPRAAVPVMVERNTNIFTMDDVEQLGMYSVPECFTSFFCDILLPLELINLNLFLV
jgi:agmatinase